mgnify:CR=1 FL=1
MYVCASNKHKCCTCGNHGVRDFRQLMKQAARYLVGTHDFRNLCKMDVVHVSNFVRCDLSRRCGCAT